MQPVHPHSALVRTFRRNNGGETRIVKNIFMHFVYFLLVFRLFICFSFRMNLKDLAAKPLKTSQINLLAKLESFGVTAGTEKQERVNRMTGVRVMLDPLAVALFDFIMEVYYGPNGYLATYGFNYRGHKFTVQLFDNTRYLFLALWPDAYSDLID